MLDVERNCRERPVAGQAGLPTVALGPGLSLMMRDALPWPFTLGSLDPQSLQLARPE